jgi:hypothetical protein
MTVGAQRRYVEIMRDVEELINDHSKFSCIESPRFLLTQTKLLIRKLGLRTDQN